MLSANLLLPCNTTLFQPHTLFFTSLSPTTPHNHTQITNIKHKNATRTLRFSPQNLLFQHSINSERCPNDLSTTQWLEETMLASWLQCSYSFKDVKRVHAVVLKCLSLPGTYIYNNLITAYVRIGKLGDARKVFDVMPERNVVSWTAMMNGYLRFGFYDEALELFKCCIESGVRGNSQTFVCALNLCCRVLDFELGRQIHGCVVKGGLRNLILDSTLVYFYQQFGELSSAVVLFDRMSKRDVVCWTTMITAYAQHGCGDEAFVMFSRMLSDGFSPNEFTVASVLNVCGEQKELRCGKQLHGAIVKRMYKNDVFVGTSLVDMYAKCGDMLESRKVFDRMRVRNTVTWTSIIAGYARNEMGEEAIALFRWMKRLKILSNDLTVVSILRACGSMLALPTGREVHAQIIKSSDETNLYLGSSLVWFYCKCGEYSLASNVLHQMPIRDVVSWTAMISGCANLGHESEALEFLKSMLDDGVEPNSFTYSSVLKACAKLEDVLKGKEIHSVTNKIPAIYNVFVGSALVYMYAKCGHVSEAFHVFDSMPERNLVSWRTMIVGCAKNGQCQEALKLMYRMQAEGIEVDDHVFATVLTECGGMEWDTELSFEFSLPSNR